MRSPLYDRDQTRPLSSRNRESKNLWTKKWTIKKNPMLFRQMQEKWNVSCGSDRETLVILVQIIIMPTIAEHAWFMNGKTRDLCDLELQHNDRDSQTTVMLNLWHFFSSEDPKGTNVQWRRKWQFDIFFTCPCRFSFHWLWKFFLQICIAVTSGYRAETLCSVSHFALKGP